jgi:iron complex outermembrane receptor protein
MHNKKHLTVAVASVLAATAHAAIAQEQADATRSAALEEVVVTAMRRDQNIQDVPMTVTAITPEDIQEFALFNFEDLQLLSPGLALDDRGAFGSVAQLRGVGFDSNASAAPAVDIYINDTPVDANYAFQSIYDIGQVEVLRGPQGTLRGRPSPAGAITMTTQRPNLEGLGGMVQGSASDQDATNAQGAVNVPLIDDQLALRLAGVYQEDDGNGVSSFNSSAEDNRETKSWRASLRWAPTETLDATLTHQWLKSDRTRLQEVEGPGAGYNGPAISSSGHSVQEGKPGGDSGDQEFQLTSLNATWDLDGHRLIFSGAHQDNSFDYTQELDIYNAVTNFEQTQTTHSTFEVDTAELRLESSDPELFMDYLVGLWYQKDKTGTTFAQGQPQSGAFGDPQMPSPFGPPDPAYIVNASGSIPTKSENKAIYSNLVFHLTDATDLSVGARYLENDQSRSQTISTDDTLIDVAIAPGVPLNCNDFAAFAPFTGNQRFPGFCELDLAASSVTQSADEQLDHWVYTTSLKHNFTDELMSYVTYSHSWRPAGVTVGITSPLTPEDLISGDAETSDSYELGMRSEWLDGRLRVNASAYHQDYNNFIGRFNDVPYVGPGDQLQAGGFTYPGNAVVNGGELDVTYDVNDNWYVQLTTAYADGHYDDADVPCRDTNLDGNPDSGDIGNISAADFGGNSVIFCSVDYAISTIPKWVTTLQSQYTFEVLEHEAYVRGLFNYYGAQEDIGQEFEADSYGILNLYVGVSGQDQQWDVSLWAKNLLDDDTRLNQGLPQTVYAAFEPNYYTVAFVPEREVGITLRYFFGEG